jgi:FkbM family methyltransferase
MSNGVGKLRELYRSARVVAQQALGIEPIVLREIAPSLEFHGNDYCGWSIPRGTLSGDSVIVDVGLGEDVSFSRSLMGAYGCRVHGFDPTPRAIAYVKSLACESLLVHEFGVSGGSGKAIFYLPNNESHVSGSLIPEQHVGRTQIEVNLLGMKDVLRTIGADRIDVLKIDIEGAEYELLASAEFRDCAPSVGVLCIEFHHRWSTYGRGATLTAVRTLRELGFRCAWRSTTTNEEFTFVNTRHRSSR